MKKLVVSSIMTATFLLVGCGGGSSNSTNSSALTDTTSPINASANDTLANTENIGTGYYIDNAVEGVDYKCGKQEGTTDANGTFIFENGQNCIFKLGDLKLREVNASSLEDKVSVLEDNTTVAQLLQTLDKDGNASNGIQLVPETGAIVRDYISSLDTPPDSDLLSAIHDALKSSQPENYHGRVVDENQTNAHLDETRNRLSREGRRTQHEVEAEHRGLGRFGDNNGTIPTQEEIDARQREFLGENNGTIPTQEEIDARQREFLGENNESSIGSQRGANQNINSSGSSRGGFRG